MNRSIVPWIVAVVAVQASMILYLENSYLRKENRICNSAGNLLRDQVSELNSALSRITLERDYVANRNYVLGATQALKEPQRFSELWHDGYNTGLDQVQYVKDHQGE